jgi:hypothetical protein
MVVMALKEDGTHVISLVIGDYDGDEVEEFTTL